MELVLQNMKVYQASRGYIFVSHGVRCWVGVEGGCTGQSLTCPVPSFVGRHVHCFRYDCHVCSSLQQSVRRSCKINEVRFHPKSRSSSNLVRTIVSCTRERKQGVVSIASRAPRGGYASNISIHGARLLRRGDRPNEARCGVGKYGWIKWRHESPTDQSRLETTVRNLHILMSIAPGL